MKTQRMMNTDFGYGSMSDIYYFSIFNRWKGIYEQLIHTLDTFSAECAGLSSILPHSDSRRWSGQEESLAYINTALVSLETRLSQISNARATLGTARNRVESLTPFSKLPREIIVEILSLANTDPIIGSRYNEDHPTRQSHSPLLSMSDTCRYLRNVAINMPSIWTNINLAVENSKDAHLRYGQRFLLYSQRLPLRVCITGDMDYEDYKAAKYHLLGLLAPHADRIASLRFHIPLCCAFDVLAGLFSRNISTQMKELYFDDSKIRLGNEFPEQFIHGNTFYVLKSLKVLGMRGFFMPLESSAYSNLTILKIMPLEFSDGMHLLDLRNTLEECPKLRSLALVGCELWLSSEEPIQPVSLPDLEVLDLRMLCDEDVLMALTSFILPGSNNLALGISIHSSISQYAMARLRDFMRRSNVTRLCIGADFLTFINHLDWLLATPEDDIFTIQELALSGYRFSKPVDNQPLNANHFPFLHTLHLMGGSDLDAEKCRQILDASKVQVLRTDNSRELVAALSGIVPSVEYRRYFTICHGESDLEWPLYVLD